MPQNTYRCPKCAAALRFTTPQAGKLFKCKACKTVFRLGQEVEHQVSNPDPKHEAAPRSKIGAKTVEAVNPAPPRPKPSARRKEDEDDDRQPSRKPRRGDTAKSTSSGKGLWLLVGLGVAAGVLLLCGGSSVIALALWLGGSRQPLAQNAPETSPRFDLPAASKPAGSNVSGAGSGQGARNPVFDGPLPDITPVPAGATPILVLDPGGHSSTVRSVLFTPDGSRVVSISRDKTVRVWDAKTGEVSSTIYLPIGPGREGSFESAAISPDGKHLVVAAIPVGDGKNGYPFFVLSLETGLVEAAVKGNKAYITALAFSRDGSVLATGSVNGDILLFQVAGWRQGGELKGHKATVKQIAFGPTSSQLVSGSEDGTLRLWNAQEPNPRKVVNAHGDGCNAVVWSADGKTIVSGGTDGFVRFWTEAGDTVHALPFKRDAIVTQITSLDITRDGSKVVFGGVDSTGSVGVIDAAARQRVLEFKEHTNTVMTVGFAPDGKLAVSSGGGNHETFIWKTGDGQVVHRLFGGGKCVWGVGWSPDGSSIAWGNENRGSTIQAQTPLEYSFRLDTLEQGMAPGANFLRVPRSVGSYTVEALDFFRLQVKLNGKPTIVLAAPRDKERIYSVSVAPGERAIIGGSAGLYLADLKTGKLLREYKGHNFLVTGVSPSPDGKYFVTGSADETIRIWRYDRDTPLLSLFFVENEWIAWSPEGYYAASPNGERLMGWQVNNGEDRNALYYPAIQFPNPL